MRSSFLINKSHSRIGRDRRAVKIVYWGKYIDTYLTDTFTRLQELAGEPIHYVLVEETFNRRQAKGQQLVDLSVNPVIQLPHRGFAKKSLGILEDNTDAIHIYLSFWGDKQLFGVLLRALWRRRKVAVIFEPYSTTPHGYWKDEGRFRSLLKVLSRRIAYRMLWPLLRLASRDKLPCVLAVSPMAEEQLHRVGFPAEVIYLLGYFVDFGFFTDLRLLMVNWAILLAAVAVIVGVINLSRVHWQRIKSHQNGWFYSLVLIFCFLGSLVVVAYFGPVSTPSIFIFNYVLAPIEMSLMALLAIILLMTSIKLLRRRLTGHSLIFLGVVLLVILGTVALPGVEFPALQEVKNWVVQTWAGAGALSRLWPMWWRHRRCT